ncbi:MAG: hypothetical protein A2289_03505 [Deltaproteobacteria bacterium RIFOXYA12_FULL_58_15]|nr:MAG: hypothetical protein A2289_03505 [Deltaproteobacteria bacterium RIFOXYA12_FULL_58_15]OGR14250.1 MAG: hypothetical protein A2341_13605 [Deltaproteobacteria bacterium RIFOXYB12_FULL_58_9]
MCTLKAVVHGGRVVVEEPVDYPDGTVVELAVVETGDEDLTEAQLARLDASLDASRKELEAGKGIPAEEVIRRLRAK